VTFFVGISSFTKLLTGADEFRFYPLWAGGCRWRIRGDSVVLV